MHLGTSCCAVLQWLRSVVYHMALILAKKKKIGKCEHNLLIDSHLSVNLLKCQYFNKMVYFLKGLFRRPAGRPFPALRADIIIHVTIPHILN